MNLYPFDEGAAERRSPDRGRLGNEVSDLLKRCDEASEVARQAFAAGDTVTGIAAIQLAAQLVQLARAFETTFPDQKPVKNPLRGGAAATLKVRS